MSGVYTSRYGNAAGKPPATASPKYAGMPMDHSYGPGPGLSAGGTPFNGPVTVQGEVTANLLVNPDLITVRANNTGRADVANPLGMYANENELNILQHELLFIQTSERTYSPNAPTRSGPPRAFSSFTGIETGYRFANQEQFEERFFCIGRAKSNYKFGNPQSRREGIAVQVSGSCTLTNHGPYKLTAGDYFKVRPPHIDPQVRNEESMMIHRNAETSRNKHVGIIERVRFEDIHRLPNMSISMYLADKAKRTDAEQAEFLRTGYMPALTDKSLMSQQRFFLGAMRNEATIGAFTIIMTAIQAGWIRFADNAFAGADLELDNLPQPDPQVLGLAEQLAQALGLVAGGTHQPNTVDAMIMRLNAGLMDQEMTQDVQMASSLLNLKPGAVAAPAPGDWLSQVALAQYNYPRIKYGYFGDAYRASVANIRGIVIRGADPGNEFDAVL